MVLALSLFSGHPVFAGDIMPFKLFDGHPHLIADDTVAYPRLEPLPDGEHRPGNPNGFGGIGGGLPAGSGGQPGVKVPNPVRSVPDASRMIKWMSEIGVEGAAAIQKRGTYALDNSYILDSSVRFPETFMPVVILDPVDEKTPDQLRKMIQENGLSGIRLTGQVGADGSFPWLESAQALKVWEVADEAGLVMDLMIFETGNFPDIVALLGRFSKAYPNVRIVLDHALFPALEGAPDFGIDENFKALSKLSNVYYKVTIINLDMLREVDLSAEDFMRHLVDVYGADHVLWGSDIGNSAGTYEEIVGRIVASTAKLSDDEKRAVLHDTGAGVFIRGGSRSGK
jgi:predicted TIM-barrel fold metal-dependent hydrolase